jgi:hypothetical protein
VEVGAEACCGEFFCDDRYECEAEPAESEAPAVVVPEVFGGEEGFGLVQVLLQHYGLYMRERG